jgi:hypothetical protein
MTKLKIKYFEHPSVANGATVSNEWTADRDYILRGILICRKDGAAFTASDVTIRINKDPLTLDKALCSTFGSDHLNYWPLEEDLKKDWPIDYSIVNREGATVDITVQLILEVR